MELIANELSVDQYVFDSFEKMKDFSEVYKKLRMYGITTCRIATSDLLIIQNALSKDKRKRNLLNLVYAFLRTPFEEGDKISENEENYYGSDWKYLDKNCLGLAMSYLIGTISLSFDASKWPASIELTKNKDTIWVRNVSKENDVMIHADWIESFKEIELLKSEIEPNQKKIYLRHDHGEDVLRKFSKRLVRSPYVIEIINSLPFNSKDRDFIRKIDENGTIECVLTWTDEGIGVVIKTTGRNYRETEKIAEILRKQFAK